MGKSKHVTKQANTKKKSIRTAKKVTNRNASPSAYGWCFQVGSGISLILDNVKDFTHLKMEGESDDIEITFNEGKKLYAQAKSVTKIDDERNVSKNLADALKVLSEDNQNGDAFKLIYITNIANPLSSKITSVFQYGHSYDFSNLPTDAQLNITNKIDKKFPVDKFQLQIINFFGEGDNKFQSIKEKIEVFLRDAIGDPSYSNSLLNNWFETFMVNAADKPSEEKCIDLTKKQIIFPIIALVINPPINEAEFNKVCDYENYNEVTQEFRKIISSSICDYEFTVQVLCDYLEKRQTALDKINYKYIFSKNEWQNYEKEFEHIKNDERRQALIKILILTIITNNTLINDIKKAVNL